MNYSESVIGSARAAQDASATGTTALTILLVTAQRAILLATLTPANSCTMSVSGASSANLQVLLETLNTSGFTTAISGTTLTIAWSK